MLAVALEGIDNVLKVGKEHFTQSGENQFALMFEQEGGLDKLEELQYHANHQIYDRVIKILELYFQEENQQFMIDENTLGGGQEGATFHF